MAAMASALSGAHLQVQVFNVKGESRLCSISGLRLCPGSAFWSGRGGQLWGTSCLQFAKGQRMRYLQPLGVSSIIAPQEAVSDDKPGKEQDDEDEMGRLTPSAFEVQSLLMEVCDETSIAELRLKVGAFNLHMKRDVGKVKGTTFSVPVAPPVPSEPMVDSVPAASSGPAVAPSKPKAPSTSIATLLSTPASKTGSRFGLLEAAADEGLAFVTSPKVGFFRRSRVVKGKSGRPLCEEGQIIKDGQVVCYLEQLGTQQPVEAEASGEVVKVLLEDGDPVGYGDPLIAIRPSFPGIK
eukprot:c16398_g1_i1 orf=344-1228(-)